MTGLAAGQSAGQGVTGRDLVSQGQRKRMRVLLVGNYEPDRQQSMARYAKWLLLSMKARGLTVLLIRPVPWFSRLAVGPLRDGAVAKYLGYLDKYWIFPRQLKTAAKQFDLVHLCDHSNSMYLGAVGKTPALITCHDVLAVRAARGEFRATRTGWSGRLQQRWILSGLKRARHVVCVSEKTKSDLLRLTGEAERHSTGVRVILNPLNWHFKPALQMPSELAERVGLRAGDSYFLHVGGNQWYKNRAGVVEIFSALAKMPEFAETRLVMAGKPLTPELRRRIEASGLGQRVLAVTGTSNEELESLYTGALALIFPSLEEGFGWPIAEAQACGCPVATTNRPPMTEVAGGAAILIDPEEPVRAAEAIRIGLKDDEGLRAAGFRNVERCGAERIAGQYLDFYGWVLSR